jgi:hypothetical protein
VYARTLEHEGEERTLTFGVSGKLIMNVLVMFDRETDTYWSQILGEAVEGPLQGAQLTALPVLQTTWSEWKRLHPETLALVTDGNGIYDTYSSYYRSNQTGVIGETLSDDRLLAKELVIGAVLGDAQIVYPHSLLAERIIVNDEVDGRPLLVAFQPDTKAGLIFDRTLDGQTLTFQRTEDPFEIVDDETGSTWYLLTGRAIDGPLDGQELERIPSTSSFWFGWKDWYPDTLIYEG